MAIAPGPMRIIRFAGGEFHIESAEPTPTTYRAVKVDIPINSRHAVEMKPDPADASAVAIYTRAALTIREVYYA